MSGINHGSIILCDQNMLTQNQKYFMPETTSGDEKTHQRYSNILVLLKQGDIIIRLNSCHLRICAPTCWSIS